MWLIFISIQLLSTEINFQSECSGESLSLFQRHSQGMTQEWQSLRVFQRTDRMKGMGRGGGIWDRWEGNSSVGPVNHFIYLIEFQPTPIPSNPQHKTKRPTQPREPDPHHQRTERDSERGGVWLGEVRDERRPETRQRGTRPHSQRTGRDSERGEGVTGSEWGMREDPTRPKGTRPPTPNGQKWGWEVQSWKMR